MSKYLKVILGSILGLFVVVVILYGIKYKNYHKPPEPSIVQGFVKLGRRYKLFIDTRKLREENTDLVYKALKNYKVTRINKQQKWYSVKIFSLSPETFVLDHGMQIKERSKKTLTFEKDGLLYMANKFNYFTFDAWSVNVAAPNSLKLQPVLAYVNYPDVLGLKSTDTQECIALDNKCIYVTPFVALGEIVKDQYNATAYLVLFRDLFVSLKGEFAVSFDLANLYRSFINNGGIKYIRLTTVKQGSYVCNDCTCEFGSQLDPEVVLFKSLDVKNFELVYFLIPRHITPDVVEGYLVPFYKVYMEGTTQSGQDNYLVQMEVLIPTFNFE